MRDKTKLHCAIFAKLFVWITLAMTFAATHAHKTMSCPTMQAKVTSNDLITATRQ